MNITKKSGTRASGKQPKEFGQVDSGVHGFHCGVESELEESGKNNGQRCQEKGNYQVIVLPGSPITFPLLFILRNYVVSETM